jgi:hypothetical protein
MMNGTGVVASALGAALALYFTLGTRSGEFGGTVVATPKPEPGHVSVQTAGDLSGENDMLY